MSHHHGTLRGLDYVLKSSTNDGRFGRMFRWLPQEIFCDKVLEEIARTMVQGEFLKPDSHEERGLKFVPKTAGDYQGGKRPKFLDKAINEAEPEDENPLIPAGYTYLGQFIDHDITFDPASSLQRQNDPDAVKNFRTPRLDLDSMYGRGPKDQPYLYKDGLEFLLGKRPSELPRNDQGRALIGDPRNDENRIISQFHALFLSFHNKVIRELIELRKQTKSDSTAKLDSEERDKIFEEAQRIVRWHYQWIVLHDYLPKIVGKEMVAAILSGKRNDKKASQDKSLGSPGLRGETGEDSSNSYIHFHPKGSLSQFFQGPGKIEPDLLFYKPESGLAYIPVEFSVAAFRFGHSMVRPSYTLNRKIGGEQRKVKGEEDTRFSRIPIFSEQETPKASLKGFEPLPTGWKLNFKLFFGKIPTDRGKNPYLAQPSYRIDTHLVDPLAILPQGVAARPRILALLNLMRGSSFGLPSGQNVARIMGLRPLDDKQLWEEKPIEENQLWEFQREVFATASKEGPVVGIDRSEIIEAKENSELRNCAPLWYYILREAELMQAKADRIKDEETKTEKSVGGHHLGPVGGRIVAEVLIGITYHDRFSYLFQDPAWTPLTEEDRSGISLVWKDKLYNKDEGYTIMDLIRWVTDGKMKL